METRVESERTLRVYQTGSEGVSGQW
jgi:hypothetical protein